MQDYEESVSFLGTWGPFQKRVFFLLCLTSIPGGYNLLSVIFLLATPSHHCHIPTHSNLSQDWSEASIPVQQMAGGRPERSSCSRYELDLVQNLSAMGSTPTLNWIINLSSPEVLVSSLKREGCKDGWTYSTEHYDSTVVSEEDSLDASFLDRSLTGTLQFQFKQLLCLPLPSADSELAEVWQEACSVWCHLHNEPLQQCHGLLAILAHLHRTLLHAGNGSNHQLHCCVCTGLIPESPRWLVSRGRIQEAELLLRSAALDNRVEAPYDIFIPANVEKETSEKVESTSILDLLRTANIRNVSIMLWIIWFSLNVSFFGLSFNMSALYGNPFLNYFLLSAVELPAYTASWLAARSLPRRLSCISFTLLGALALLLIQITLYSNAAITLTLVLLGKFGILAGIGVLYMFTSELSPTVIRNTAMSSCAMFSRVGSSVSPYLLQLAVFNQFLPWIIVGCLSLLSVLVCFFLPETFKQPLIDTIEQMPPLQRFRWPWASMPPPKDDGKLTKDQTTAPEIICTTRL
ncbi:organic cation/carnitine transporter 2-like isoform X4 [Eleginops maclovinus]|uniref:organic cation/carnitine transporter 2-like isoform X4 n=1 Tax=Eleginops maclovinus TaxID=56733 RepID=UPI00308013F3